MPSRRSTDRGMLRATALPALAAAVAVALTFTCPAWAADARALPADPLKSGKWADLVQRLLPDAPVVLDERVRIVVPGIVENQAQAPIAADARALPGVRKLLVFADFNPIEHVLTLIPGKAAPYVSFRMKLEQGTPVRAAALAADGKWHVSSVYLDAAGGGCSQPAMARKDADWSTTVGWTQGKTWREAGGETRVRLRIRHPMDTGLAKDNTPPYFIERLDARGPGGEPLAVVEMHEPMSEDPVLTLLVELPANAPRLDVEARDNNGGVFRSSIPAALTQ